MAAPALVNVRRVLFMKALFTFICAVLVFGSGCASRPPLKHETLAKINERETTREQVETLLGTPDERLTDGSRRTLYVYADEKARQRFHLLKDKFDHYFLRAFFLFEMDGVLLKKLISETRTSSSRGFHGITVGAPVTDEQLGKLKELMSAREVLEILGPPLTEELTLDGYIVRRWMFIRQGLFATRANVQDVTVVFEGETELVKNFTISDNLPPEKKKSQ